MKIDLCLTETGASVLHAHGISPEAYTPAYDGESVGLDLYHAGEEIVLPGRNKWVAFDEPTFNLPTGIKINVPKGCVALVKERGSITSLGLVLRAGVIDPGYTDEIFVNLINVGEKDIRVLPGAKLPVQLIITPCYTNFNIISNLEYLEKTAAAKRQTGSLGSSNNESKKDPDLSKRAEEWKKPFYPRPEESE